MSRQPDGDHAEPAGQPPGPTDDGKRIEITTEWCKGCGICVAVCGKHVLVMRHGKAVVERLEDCNVCRSCEEHCPDLAICVVCGKRKVEAR